MRFAFASRSDDSSRTAQMSAMVAGPKPQAAPSSEAICRSEFQAGSEAIM